MNQPSTVYYEIFVRSFYDSDGDGIGDFKGLTEKLDYLNDGNPDTHDDLGIGGIWLMPINPSPSYHGYDVTNYREINPDYGTMEDFQEFIHEAHKRGIKVIMDLVVNHTSNKSILGLLNLPRTRIANIVTGIRGLKIMAAVSGEPALQAAVILGILPKTRRSII